MEYVVATLGVIVFVGFVYWRVTKANEKDSTGTGGLGDGGSNTQEH